MNRDDAKAVEPPVEDMSGELQTIPARHGVATFVPRGRTIKVINTYGKQVVSMWAFSLGPPPDKDEEEEAINEQKVQEETEGLKKAVEAGAGAGENMATVMKEEGNNSEVVDDNTEDGEESKESKSVTKDAKGTPDDGHQIEEAPTAQKNNTSTENGDASSKEVPKRSWASYLPSIPYRNKGTTSKLGNEKKPDAEEQKAQNEANTKKWSSYIPTGKSFSSYVPNVQLPDSKEAVSAFKASHYRDPNKSYAEQLYDFSKTPVGAGTIAAATGSGYASSVYAAYSAYASTHPSSSSQPPMEYLSLPHTRASSHKLVPEVNDQLLTNLRNPIVSLIEDTSPGAHDTLTAACDANQYLALGVDKSEEHGSCAENLVLALKELNQTAGLKGAKAIGADISVNIAPTPLHLFMNAPLHFEHADPKGAGALGITLSVEEPVGKKRSFVRFRAERDVVVVLSACPMEVGQQNGGRCMAANFMVEDVADGEDLAASVTKGGAARGEGGKVQRKGGVQEKLKEKEENTINEQKPKAGKQEDVAPVMQDKDNGDEEMSPSQPSPTQHSNNKEEQQQQQQPTDPNPKPKKKPRKLQSRNTSSTT